MDADQSNTTNSLTQRRKSKAVVEQDDDDHGSTDDSTIVASPPRITRKRTPDPAQRGKSKRYSQRTIQSDNETQDAQSNNVDDDPATEKKKVHKRILLIVLLTHTLLTFGHYISQRFCHTGALSGLEQTLVATMENATEESELAIISRANAATVNYVQDWYNQLNESLLPSRSLTSPQESIDEPSCLEALFADFQASFPLTDPESMDVILQDMGIAKYPDLVDPIAHAGLLKEPQSTTNVFESSLMCVKEHHAIEKLACQTLKHFPHGLTANMTQDEHKSTQRSLGKAMVVDILTQHATQEFVTLKSVLGTIREHDTHMLSQYDQKHKENKSLREYAIKKHKQVSDRLVEYLEGVSQSSQTMENMSSLLKLGIIEAVKIDLERGMEANARVGIALASAINFAGTAIEPFFDDHKMTWLLGSNWVEAYVAWHLTFNAASHSFSTIPEVLAPALACRISSENGERFMAAHMIANGLSLTSLSLAAASEGSSRQQLHESSSWEDFLMSLGQSNLESLDLPVLSDEEVSLMFQELIDQYGSDFLNAHSGASAAPILKDFDIHEYVTFLGLVLFVTKVIAGIGLELRSIWNFPQSIEDWKDNHSSNYKIKALLQPLMSSATLYLSATRNGLSILTTVTSLWKDGMPESIAFVYAALFHPEKGRSTFACRLSDFLSGTGTTMQNSGASMLASMLLTGVISPTREILDPASILVIQHWTLPLQYLNIWLYGIFAVVTEIWFEWSVFGNQNELLKEHWSAASGYLVIIAAHWFFLISAALNIRATGSPIGVELANVASHLAVKVNMKEIKTTIQDFDGGDEETLEKEDRGDNGDGKDEEQDEEQIDFVDQIERLFFLQEEGKMHAGRNETEIGDSRRPNPKASAKKLGSIQDESEHDDDDLWEQA